LVFSPVSPWLAGTRYAMNLSGQVRSLDGRELRLEKCVFFYAINDSPAPLVEWFCPIDGASVAVFTENPGDNVIEIMFSRPMDRFSTELAFSIDGVGEKIFHWSDDDMRLAVNPDKNLSPWVIYRWTLKNTARSRDSVPLAKAVSACFVTDLRRQLPCVLGAYPAIFSQGRWLANGGLLETHLGPGQGIVIEFTKRMADSSLNSIRFDPSLTGKIERISETAIVFIPARDPQPELSYTMIVPADAKDEEGLKMGTDFRAHFIADIPYLKIMSFNADGVPVLNLTDRNTEKTGGGLYPGQALAVPIDVPGADALRFTIRFSLPFELEARQGIPKSITLEPYFPHTLAPVALRFVSWLSDDRLRMEWEGLKPGISGQPHYYKLVITGGSSGVNTGNGMYMKESQFIVLEAL